MNAKDRADVYNLVMALNTKGIFESLDREERTVLADDLYRRAMAESDRGCLLKAALMAVLAEDLIRISSSTSRRAQFR